MSSHQHRHGPDEPEHRHHAHGHRHGIGAHAHAPASFGRAFAIGIALNTAYVLGEALFGIMEHSLALLADAGHNLGDVFGLAAAWGASVFGTRKPAGRYTYGLRRLSVLAALGNAVVLLFVTGGIAWEAVRRLAAPQAAGGITIMIVAAVGILVNGISAWLFMSGRQDDLNIRGAFTHMASDALVALGVVIAGGLILWTGWLWLDPAISLVISVVIVFATWSLLRDAVNLSLDAVPRGIDRHAVIACLSGLPDVLEVHDLHIWGMSTTETALTAHLVLADLAPGGSLIRLACTEMHTRFGIGHATFQVETLEMARCCAMRSDSVV
jgi:cobalt-zinc-cadmium efflux system protein